MKLEDWLERFPKKLRVGTEKAGWYLRMPHGMAVQGTVPSSLQPACRSRLEAEDITLCQGEAIEVPSAVAETATALYEHETGGGALVPTGEVFVRWTRGVTVDALQASFEDAGYEVARTLVYAPNAAWLRAVDGGVSVALANISRLEVIDAVENVEPQMLGARATR